MAIMPRTNHPSKRLIAAIAIIGLSSLALIAHWQQTKNRSYSILDSTRLIPKTAIAAAFIVPNPTALNYLEDFSTPEARTWFNQTLIPLKQQALAGTSLSYDRDLKPWMGGVLVAILPGSNPTTPNLIMVIGIKDKLRAWNFARRLNQQPDLNRQVSQYQGIKITQYQESDHKQYHVAVLQDHLLIAASRQAIEQAIESTQSQTSLATVEGISEQFLGSVAVPNPLITAYIANYPQFMDVITKATEKSPEKSTEKPSQPTLQILTQLQSLQSLILGIGIDSAGFRLKLVTHLAPRNAPESSPQIPLQANQGSQPAVGRLLDRLPTETIALVDLQGIDQIWSYLTTSPPHSPLENLAGQVRQALKTINLDADQDVFGWMDGELALGAVASEEGVLAPLGLGGVLVLETSDRTQAEDTLDKLDRVIGESSPPVNVEQRTLEE